jgi:hydroxymethylpyrimidine pyrophosphatase-like HAD family hydrolase
VGDDANDVPMIRNAGWGVAMDHSPEFVKKHAQWIAPSNVDDGVIAVVEKLIKA